MQHLMFHMLLHSKSIFLLCHICNLTVGGRVDGPSMTSVPFVQPPGETAIASATSSSTLLHFFRRFTNWLQQCNRDFLPAGRPVRSRRGWKLEVFPCNVDPVNVKL